MVATTHSKKLVGREAELQELEGHLDRAKTNGQLLLISGEAGVGKTSLVGSITERAQEQGYKVLQGRALPGSHAPYLVFVDALKKEGLEDILVDKPPKIDRLLWIYNDGRMLTEAGSSGIDAEILSGMLTAVQSFVAESMQTSGELGKLEYGSYDILLTKGEHSYTATIVEGRATKSLKEDLKTSLKQVENKHSKELAEWEGQQSLFDNTEEFLNLIEQYTGTKYELDAKTERDRLFENASQNLIEESEKQPLLIFLDDLHWADQSSLSLLHYLTRSAADSPIFLIGTYRPEDLTSELKNLLDNLDREGLKNELQLNRLSKDAVEKLIISEFNAAPEDFVEKLYKESDGNPFFAKEILRSLEEECIISKYNIVWAQSLNLNELRIPHGISAVVQQRLEKLDSDSRDIIEWASVIGNEFEKDILKAISGDSARKISQALRKLREANIVKKLEDNVYAFDHAKIQETLYSSLDSDEVQEMHETIAKAILDVHKGDEEKYPELAKHLSVAAQARTASQTLLEDAVKYNTLAGNQAKNKYANEDAIKLYEQALEVLEKLSGSEEKTKREIEILSNIAPLSDLIGETDNAISYYDKIIQNAQQIKYGEKEAKALLEKGIIFIKNSNWSEAEKGLKQSLIIYKELEDLSGEGEIYFAFGHLNLLTGKYSAALDYYNKCRELAKQNNDLDLEARAMSRIGRTNVAQGDTIFIIDSLENAKKIFKNLGNKKELLLVHNFLGIALANQEKNDSALIEYTNALNIAEQIGDLRYTANNLNNCATIYTRKTEYDLAENALNKAINIFQKLNNAADLAVVYDSYGSLLRAKKDYNAAIEWFNKAIKLAESANVPNLSGESNYNLGLTYKDQGNIDAAREHLTKAENIFEKIGSNDYLQKVRTALSGL